MDNLQTAIEAIKARIEECKKNGTVFILPKLDGAEIIEENPEPIGSELLHQDYFIKLADGCTINIMYQSKDKCRTFQIKPDVSIISVKCSDSNYNFTDGWDEKN